MSSTTPRVANKDMQTEFDAQVVGFVDRLNKYLANRIKKGDRPLYTAFGFTLGPSHARVYAVVRGSKTAIAFIGRDGMIRRADSWKRPGRILGEPASKLVFEYVSGPAFR